MDALGVTTTTVSLDESIAQALQNRPELRQRQLETQISQINLLSAKNGTLPQLDFSLQYGYNGVGGTQTFFDPTTGLPVATLEQVSAVELRDAVERGDGGGDRLRGHGDDFGVARSAGPQRGERGCR